jgi:GTP-binding protein
MKFIDEADITVKAGNGGAGAKSFRREKFVPFGGPDGGDGGDGGSVILESDNNIHTLLDLRFRPVWQAQNGEAGSGRNCTGKSGEDLTIRLPVGTQVFTLSDDQLICDLDQHGTRFVLAKGGRGGKGNNFFKSATNQVPEHSQPGEEGQGGEYKLSLKLVAEVGIIGFPNAGKSTLISRISSARPKIADYPFTTLTPNLGVVRLISGRSFVAADIPGLVPGAHQGRGLGIQFLKHVERTSILLHLIDPFQIDENGKEIKAVEAYKMINNELKLFSEELANKPQIVGITKLDAMTDQSIINNIVKDFKKYKIKVVPFSSVSGQAIDDLLNEVQKYLL